MLAVLASGCQLRLALDVVVTDDGSGSVTISVALDEELAELLAEADVDLEVGLEEATAAAPEWEVERVALDDGFRLDLTAPFDDPEHLERLLREFHDGLGPEDAALFDDLRLEALASGAYRFSGQAGLRLPSTIGVEGEGIEFDVDDLEVLLEERGEEFVRSELRVTLPAEPVEHDADVREENTLIWRLPTGEFDDVVAVSAEPADVDLLLAGAIALGTAVVTALAVVWFRRRRA